MADWQKARLIPTSGIRSSSEAEARAASALLAVLSVVRPYSKSILAPLGASKADKAVVETFIEVPFADGSGKTIRPDGLVRVAYGRQDPWIALVEIKTGTDAHKADQLNAYLSIARREKFQCVISISNEIAPAPGVHPVGGLKVRANSKVLIHHLSWTRLLTEAVKQKSFRGVDDPEQAWILSELIRYLEHPQSGALSFSDMGSNWVAVRDAAHASRLQKRDPMAAEIGQRWDQLIQFASLQLGSETGSDVQEVIPRGHRTDPSKRAKHLIDEMCSRGVLEGGLRVPDTAGDIGIRVDLRAQRIRVWADVSAPDDRGGRGRVSWLTRQLRDAPTTTRIESYAKGARTPEVARLPELIEDSSLALGSARLEPVRFRVSLQAQMGMNRKSGRSPGFVDSVLAAISSFYENVLQQITPYQKKAPKLRPTEQPSPGGDEGAPQIQRAVSLYAPTQWRSED